MEYRTIVVLTDQEDVVTEFDDFFAAECFRDEVLEEKFWSLDDIQGAAVEVNCAIHGWDTCSFQGCYSCYDEWVQDQERTAEEMADYW